MTIKMRNIYPPIPDRRFDWCAYHDGDEERGWRYGWGSTEQEAIADLRRLDEAWRRDRLPEVSRASHYS